MGRIAGYETLNNDQYTIATDFSRGLFVAAGAGSGKTFALTQRVARALQPGSAPDGGTVLDSLDQALIITFTGKAAANIRERVRGELLRRGLAETALQVDSAWISTIHGMCSRILHEHALELGLDPEFKMLSEDICAGLQAQSVAQVIDGLHRQGECEELFEHFAASGYGFGGRSGSSTVADMVSTLLRKAMSNPAGMDSIRPVPDEQIASLLPLASGLLEAYLDFLQLKDEWLSEVGKNKNTPRLKEDDALCHASVSFLEGYLAGGCGAGGLQVALDRGLLYAPNGRSYGRGKPDELKAARKEVQTRLDLLRAELVMQKARPLVSQLLHIVRDSYTAYQRAKEEQAGLDNDDLLCMTLSAFNSRPALAREYARRFKLVMVDEFQDTDPQQVQIIGHLIADNPAKLITVGDAQQSIYRFRGADVSVFRQMEARGSACDVVRLNENYRSHDDVLRYVAQVCGGTGADGEDPIIPDFMDLLAQQNDASPEVAAKALARHEERFADPDGPRVYVESASEYKAAADARKVLAERIAGRLQWFHEQKGQPLGDMAVLSSSNAQMGAYIDALRAHGLPCVVTGGSSFFSEAPEVRVVLALLCTLADPHDTEEGLYPLLTSGMFGLGADDLCLLAVREVADGAGAGADDGTVGSCAGVGTEISAGAGSDGDAGFLPDTHLGDFPGLAADAGSDGGAASVAMPYGCSGVGEGAGAGVSTHAAGIVDAAHLRRAHIERAFIDPKAPLISGTRPSAALQAARRVLGAAFSRMGTMPVDRVCSLAVLESGWLVRLDGAGAGGRAQAANVLGALRYVRDLTVTMGLGVTRAYHEFANWLATSKAGPKSFAGGRADAVQVMTIHASKGLQFPVVAVVGAFEEYPVRSSCLAMVKVGSDLLVSLKLPVKELEEHGVKGLPDLSSRFEKAEASHPLGGGLPSTAEKLASLYGVESCTEWYQLIRYLDAQEELQEQARLIYVALTRAEEALVVGVKLKVPKKTAGRRRLELRLVRQMLIDAEELDVDEAAAYGVVGAGIGDPQEAGTTKEITSEEDAVLEKPGSDPLDNLLMHSAAMRFSFGGGHDGLFCNSFEEDGGLGPVMLPNLPQQPSGTVDRLWVMDQTEVAAQPEAGAPMLMPDFALYEESPSTPAQRLLGRLDAGVTSFSAAKAATRGGARPIPGFFGDDSDDSESPQAFDADLATGFGSAFHLCAQYMVEARIPYGQIPSEQRIDAIAAACGVGRGELSQSDVGVNKSPAHLRDALRRWASSSLRREVLEHSVVQAEVPFFIKVRTRFGEYLEGAIDLLATDPGSREALVVDYKTGYLDIAASEFTATHKAQANFYAYALMDRGYEAVTCKFVAVQRDAKNEGGAGAAEPLVATYRFDAAHRPTLDLS